ncbi:CcoQ/FixQ family Cbb3-type cytochrome c oxidase assembly chaperone [Microbulbifer sp. A4B17]|uniref:cbb3-type cytochrome oxidase subunit 3 n=1 Tax=Microbulbifer sp. A4B17 TaxID=359370 RepID=UPI000D52AC1A|nr:cbb3-type cytochrome c oxidase subunit 3 [Microbulbifer sp. A4B17]AWF80299.1 CcoQ/FixQ family Cbb3-type cytochrome c oxidase assembly chaperone [Microbulbifer sp. A4B17]
MTIETLREIGLVLGSVAFLAICWWAFSPKRKKRFEEDANLPFADEEQQADKDKSAAQQDESNSGDKPGTNRKQGQDK